MAFRAYEGRTDMTGLAITEAALETLLSLAYDVDEPQLVEAIPALNPPAAETIRSLISELYLCAEQVDEFACDVPAHRGVREWSESEYRDVLARLARTVIGDRA